MPLKLSVGLSKKIGLPHYGSLGASCHVEVELDGGLLRADLEGFHRHVRNAFLACRQAVLEELARNHSGIGANATEPVAQEGDPNGVPGNGSQSPADGHVGNGALASAKQLEFARQLAAQIRGLGIRRLEAWCLQFCDKPLAALSSLEASNVIDKLKAVKAGKLELNDLRVAEAA